ncbi:MAG: toll/interleukin-1 receptor domain-containing protein, partial [Candidatus Sulfotelmatobacter sp.]
MATLFFSYSHVDESLRDQLETHLSGLRRQGMISSWHDRRITAGEDFGAAIDSHINTADVILLLVSPDFIASDYCYEREMKRALERHQQGDARVIPIILRPCDWHDLPFGKLLATPKDGRPVTMWPNIDQAFLD